MKWLGGGGLVDVIGPDSWEYHIKRFWYLDVEIAVYIFTNENVFLNMYTIIWNVLKYRKVICETVSI